MPRRRFDLTALGCAVLSRSQSEGVEGKAQNVGACWPLETRVS